MIKYIGIRDEKSFRVINKDYFNKDLLSLPEGKYSIIVKKFYREKSNPQLGYYYSCVLPYFLNAANDAGWEFTTIEELDFWLKSQFTNKDLINRNTGEIITIPALKRNMTTLEFSTFINKVRDYCAEFLSVYIPEPEQQIEIKI